MGIICNFTDSYLNREEFLNKEHNIIDFSDITGSNCYCSDEAKEQIRGRLSYELMSDTHYIDDGNHHYFSYFWLELIDEEFDLFMFDHHTDMQPSALLPILSCGNWLLESLLTIENLKHVYLIGPPQDREDDMAEFKDRVTFIDEAKANEDIPNLNLSGRPVYISIDEDILDASEIETIWDQGTMKRPKLNSWIDMIRSSCKVIGMDICG